MYSFLPAIPWLCITFNPSMKSSKRYTLLGTHSMRGVSYKNSSSLNLSFMARNVSSTAFTPTEDIVDDPAEMEPTLSNAPPLESPEGLRSRVKDSTLPTAATAARTATNPVDSIIIYLLVPRVFPSVVTPSVIPRY